MHHDNYAATGDVVKFSYYNEILDHVSSSCIVVLVYGLVVSFWTIYRFVKLASYMICMHKKWWAFYRHAPRSCMNGLGGIKGL